MLSTQRIAAHLRKNLLQFQRMQWATISNDRAGKAFPNRIEMNPHYRHHMVGSRLQGVVGHSALLIHMRRAA